jgi:tRNA (guanine37-N1)-methyltransferase
MRIDVFTLFPGVISSYCGTSILGRAQESGAISVIAHDLRDGAEDTHRTMDDSPFGGGAGMVLMAEPVFRAVEAVDDLPRPLFLLSPGGRPFTQEVAHELAALTTGFSLLCGRYEGVDQRITEHLVDGELSIGDVVLAGGELPALIVIEAVARLLPSVLGNDESALHESFADGLLEHPQYTRPAEFRGWEVPPVLTSGDHGAVARWRHEQALLRTAASRPDLLAALVRDSSLSDGDVQLLSVHGYDVLSGIEPENPKDASHAAH